MKGGGDKNTKIFSSVSDLAKNNDLATQDPQDELSAFLLPFAPSIAFESNEVKNLKTNKMILRGLRGNDERARRWNHIFVVFVSAPCCIQFDVKLLLKVSPRHLRLIYLSANIFSRFALPSDQPKDGNYDDGKLIIVTDSQILAIPLHRCNSEKINSCR